MMARGRQGSFSTQRWRKLALFLAPALAVVCGCVGGDPMAAFIREMDAHPERQPPNWPRVKQLISRPAPAVGQPAPDFTLTTLDQKSEITRSTFHPDRPLVLVFGSFT